MVSYMDWQDVVQISDKFTTTNIALKSDGTMLYGNLYYENRSDEWLKPISKWENIIAFDTYIDKDMAESGGVFVAVGITKTGNLCGVAGGSQTVISIDDTLKLFSDVKQVDVKCGFELRSTADLDIVALTNHGTVQSYIDGLFEEYDAPDVVDVVLFDNHEDDKFIIYELHSDGKIYEHGKNKYLLSDVVYLNNSSDGAYVNVSYAVTRSGSIYILESGAFKDAKIKTKVHNEWLERMK